VPDFGWPTIANAIIGAMPVALPAGA
jgi:hypothetical protein